MQRKTLFTVAALGATCLMPIPGALAQNTTDAAVSGSVMDAAQFRESLHGVRDLFNRIRENNNLALASQDRMVASKYEDENRRLHVKALGILDSVTQNWKTAPMGTIPGETSEMRSGRSIERLGTATAARYASESEDTAFVRTTVWELRNMLHADKLNGRPPIVNNRMVSLLDAAISRAENPSFRVAWRGMNRELLSRSIEFSRREEVVASAPREEITTTEERTEVAEAPAAVEETTIEENTQVAEAPTTVEEIITERSGAASLPQTGGDPGMLVLFGSSLIGMGAILRRRK